MSNKQSLIETLRQYARPASSSKPVDRQEIPELFAKEQETHLVTLFKQSLEAVDGTCIVVASEKEAYAQLKSLWQKADKPPVVAYEDVVCNGLKGEQIPFLNNKDAVLEARMAITGAEYLIARLGTVMVSSAQTKSRRIVAFPEIHVVVVSEQQIVYDLPEALSRIQEKYENNFPAIVSLITGPSRTADIEKTLILGAHGPKQLIVFIYKNQTSSSRFL